MGELKNFFIITKCKTYKAREIPIQKKKCTNYISRKSVPNIHTIFPNKSRDIIFVITFFTTLTLIIVIGIIKMVINDGLKVILSI
jgi:hypothetical protein